MDCTVIVATHGKLANELIETTSMLVGRYDNVRTLDFMPGENVETLILKMKNIVDFLAEEMPVLFVVDMFSGSPFNAATYFIKHRKNTKIIAGVNIPVLVNIFLERQECSTLDELADIAVISGQNSIKSL
ncbi:PTS sorbose transporter subunit IIB [Citrobacter sp. NCU1]|uniref:mannose/fructose/sorbose PTS transporter subunit IIA n=1 Tax=Citrobacter sp. NCU1 TaxID=2026683 RepID=UPI00139084A8|nr:mannose/fructose/sorbose PTS transporter subunit IIA [Citrobacter sp. NCU1]NDO83778.1 PTS sorbose transporter subunit IIB [Citrobacter sp. NCU1]